MMRTPLYVTIAIGCILNLSSCKSPYNATEKAVMQCIDKRVNRNMEKWHPKPPFNYYEFMLEIEQLLLKENAIANTTKEAYLNLLLNINDKTNASIRTKIQKLIDDKGFDFYDSYTTDGILIQCPFHNSKSKKNRSGKLFYKQALIFEQLQAKGYNNKELIKDFFDLMTTEEFNKIIYKAPVLLLVIIHIENTYTFLDEVEYQEKQRLKELEE